MAENGKTWNQGSWPNPSSEASDASPSSSFVGIHGRYLRRLNREQANKGETNTADPPVQATVTIGSIVYTAHANYPAEAGNQLKVWQKDTGSAGLSITVPKNGTKAFGYVQVNFGGSNPSDNVIRDAINADSDASKIVVASGGSAALGTITTVVDPDTSRNSATSYRSLSGGSSGSSVPPKTYSWGGGYVDVDATPNGNPDDVDEYNAELAAADKWGREMFSAMSLMLNVVRGTGTVANGNTSVAVTLSGNYVQPTTSYTVLCVPVNSSFATARYFITTKSTTGFTVNLVSAAAGDANFEWILIYSDNLKP